MLTFLELGNLGRVGNQMFQIASTIGIAKKHGYAYAFPKWENTDHLIHFNSGENIDMEKYFDNKLPRVENPGVFRKQEVPWGYHDIFLPNENISLHGHMQSEKYFKHCEADIRKVFAFNWSLQYPEYANFPQNIYTGIHLRRGDYVGKNAYHPVQGMDYFSKAMAQFPATTRFLIFSDDVPAAKEMFGNNVDYAEGNHYMTDMWLMSQCKNFIISNSTFSWWGAWLINNPTKKIIAPAKWFGPEAGDTPTADIYCDGWVII